MTDRSRREVERAVEDLAADAEPEDAGSLYMAALRADARGEDVPDDLWLAYQRAATREATE